jgi:hypothetical protein
MRELANSALAAGGEVIGVVPRVIEGRGVAHSGLTELRVVETMHERKQTMAALSDGFIALPGGFGTLEELFEAVTWLQLGVHHKPIGLLGPCGYWKPLIDMVEHMMREGFVPSDQLQLLLVESEAVALLARMQAWVPPTLGAKWVDRAG